MKSPITGKQMMLNKEIRSMDFRKETFDIVFHFLLVVFVYFSDEFVDKSLFTTPGRAVEDNMRYLIVLVEKI